MTSHKAWGEYKPEIDRLTAAFFDAVSFDAGKPPRYERLRTMFIGRGLLVNNAGPQTQLMDVDAFIAARLATYGLGETTRYVVSEISETTEIFGRVAQRTSLVRRTGSRDGRGFETRGAILMQFVQVAGPWRISAAAWDDQRPGELLMTHPEPDEFG